MRRLLGRHGARAQRGRRRCSCWSSPAAARSARRTPPCASARGEIVAFSDANALWEPGAARALVGAFDDPRVGYACGQVRFVQAAATVSGPPTRRASTGAMRWPCARWSRGCGSITAGNGAIYATRREAYMVVDPIMGHDLSFPSTWSSAVWRAVYVPSARAQREDGPVDRGGVRAQAADDEPHLADRPARRHALPTRLRPRLRPDDPLPPHPSLRHTSLAHRRARWRTCCSCIDGAGALYTVTLALQFALLSLPRLGGAVRARPLLMARYYVLTTASLAAGLWDWLRHGTEASWDVAEGTR